RLGVWLALDPAPEPPGRISEDEGCIGHLSSGILDNFLFSGMVDVADIDGLPALVLAEGGHLPPRVGDEGVAMGAGRVLRRIALPEGGEEDMSRLDEGPELPQAEADILGDQVSEQ